ncbi:hypothetical protein ACFX13_009778 [Malus domestica]
MHDSSFSSWLCELSALRCSASSTIANSLAYVSSSQATIFDCIIFETNDQLRGWDFGPVMKDNSDSKDVRVIALTSLNLLTMATVLLSLLRDEPLRFFIAFWIAFFTIFLEHKYFLTSPVSAPDSVPRLLMID